MVWSIWNSSTYTTTSITCPNDTFSYWCTNGTATTTTSTSSASTTVWVAWNEVYEDYRVLNAQPAYVASAEEIRASQRREEELREREKEARRKQKEAEDRAEKLLLENLDLKQRLDYRERHYFVVKGSSGRRYRIRRGRSGNIDVIDKKGRVEHRLCAHPNEWLPDPDTNLAQKLMLENDEEGFFKVANRHPSFDRNAVVLEALH